ncbi:MAG: hypothetical protein ACOX6J_04050, partial [Oscillospiraceae bacterium]
SQLKLGMTKSEVEAIAGKETDERNGMSVYGSGDCAAVQYTDGKASRIVLRDESASISPFRKGEYPEITAQNLTPDSTIDFEGMESAFGYPVSEIEKIYDASGAEYVRLHFGYVDPDANFDPAWRGEDTAEISYAGCTIKSWHREEETRGLLKGSLEGRLAEQYVSYSDYLGDFYAFCSAMQLTSGTPAKSEVESTLGGTLSQYDTYGEYTLCELVPSEPLSVMASDSGTTASYRITLTFDGDRMVNVFYCCLRLKDGDSLDIPDTVSRGMTMAEVFQTIGAMPTAMLYDTGSIYVCWGPQREGNTIDEQFEYVVRFGADDYIAKNCYDNSALASSGDSQGSEG